MGDGGQTSIGSQRQLQKAALLRLAKLGQIVMLKRMKDILDLPPVWFAGSAAVSWLLAKWAPVAMLGLPDWLGWGIFTLGFIWAGTAAAVFLLKRTPVEPRTTPKVLLVEYHFRFNRNPIYTGMAAMLLGWAIVLGALTAFVPVVVFPLIVSRRFIVDEEQRLKAAFGDRAKDYLERSRRW